MKSCWLKSPAVWGFTVLVLFGLWGSRVTWAERNQLPAGQTVPTRVKTPSPGFATVMPGPPSNPPPPSVSTALPVATATIPTRLTLLPTTATITRQVSPSATRDPTGVAAIVKENLPVRAAPTTAATAVGQLSKGAIVQIVGRTPNNDWWQILLATDPNVRGWIPAEVTDVSGPVDAIPIIVLAPRTESPASLPETPASSIVSSAVPTNEPTAGAEASDSSQVPITAKTIVFTALTGLTWFGLGLGFVLVLVGTATWARSRRQRN